MSDSEFMRELLRMQVQATKAAQTIPPGDHWCGPQANLDADQVNLRG